MKKLTIICLFMFSFLQISAEAAEMSSGFFVSPFHKNLYNKENQKPTNYRKAIKEPDIDVYEDDGIYIFKINTKNLKGELKPYYVTNLQTNEEVYNETGARLVVNAGFFDPKNQQTVSYVTINGQIVLHPENNKNLIENKHLQPYLDKIFNRSEFRILKSNTTGELKYDIAPHNEKVQEGYIILHAIQGGPALVPNLRLAEEFFVLTDKDGKIINESASSLSKYARTLVGIKDNNVYFVIATNDHPITLPEAAEIMQEAGYEKAMAFDGGGSVSVDFRDKNIHIFSDKNQTARKLKSFFIITPIRQANPQAYRLINAR